ncbi:hypothetical protein GORHZ_167_00070 [Gordonia rhizosphera NBRC 16068]|uniref:Ig-like domain-containing protein n=1 Tax=Gordonia rhizosphera NBRC 16068 TaxID=1108045 RepID=K6V7I1_9ACTN|nr:hypothetical protein GORHZ_167_00070 [Gordonia rhizosphera NBRC 16068]
MFRRTTKLRRMAVASGAAAASAGLVLAAASPASAAVTAVWVVPFPVYGTDCEVTVNTIVDTTDQLAVTMRYPSGKSITTVSPRVLVGTVPITFYGYKTVETGQYTVTATQSGSQKSTSFLVVPGAPCPGSGFGS